MSEIESLKYDINQIGSALDNLYSAMDDLLDVDNTDDEYNILGKTAELLEILKDRKEDELIHERGIKYERI